MEVDDKSAAPVFRLKDAFFQILATAAVYSLAIHAGINMAFTTILLPQTMVNNGTKYQVELLNNTKKLDLVIPDSLAVDADDATWIASLVTITTPIGSIVSGFLMDRFGRKATCLITALPLALAWTIAGCVTSQIYLLLISRALAGFGAGLSTVGLVYVSEVSHASVRPMLLSLNSAFVSFGILLTTLLGNLVRWRAVAWSSAALALFSLLCSTLIPESPVWLYVNQDRFSNSYDRILSSLQWLYRSSRLVQWEFQQLTRHMYDETSKLSTDQFHINDDDDFHHSKQLKVKKNIWKPVALLLGLFMLQQLSGGYIVIFYALQIFQIAGAAGIDEWTSLVILGFIRFLMAIVSVYLSRHVGRRKLLISSALGMGISMLLAGSSFLFPPSLSNSYIQSSCILVFVSFSSYGFLVIPWTLIGELLPNEVRGIGSGLMISFAYLLMFVTVKPFFYILNAIGLSYLFLFFSTISFLSIVFVYFLLPETMGKTFKEIEKGF